MFFGVKPDIVLKSGSIAYAAMGDPNASIPTPQPVIYRPMFGAMGAARTASCLTFVSGAALASGRLEAMAGGRRLAAVRGTRTVTKAQMALNDACPVIEIDPETYEVRADGEVLACEPAEVLPLAQRYFLF
jgi:urease subunit alpha